MTDEFAGHTARILDEAHADDAVVLDELRNDSATEFVDHRADLARELAGLIPRPSADVLRERGRWVHYSWRRHVVGLPGPLGFRTLRFDRNRDKITAAEQERLQRLTIGVVGLSAGHSIAHTLALEGLCGELRVADFDEVSVSNLNRIPGTVFDVGMNKSIALARRISEIDPYLAVRPLPAGITDDSIDDFLTGLDLVIEVCDSLDMKIAIREEGRNRRVPLLMQTSDRGLLDVERYDLEPDYPLFHGLMGDVSRGAFARTAPDERVALVIRSLEQEQMSPRLRESMAKVGTSLFTWPQLGSDVQLGGAIIAAAVRRFALGGQLPSGRVRMDIDAALDNLRPPQLVRVR